MLLERDGDLDEAAKLIEASLKQDPKNGSTMDSWGWVLFKQGKTAEAEEALRKAVEQNPFSPEIRRHYGEVLLKMGKQEEALEQWERALAYVFPGRKDLEKRAKELGQDVLRKKAPAPEESETPDSNETDDEP
jgi:predicted Zn-dependent protease